MAVASGSKVSGLDVGAMDDNNLQAVKTTNKLQQGSRWTFARAFVALSVVAVVCTLLYAPRLGPRIERRGATAAFLQGPRAGRSGVADGDGDSGVGPVVLDNQVGSPCSSMAENSICCDRSDYHSDVCFMSGDVRTDAKSLSLLLFSPQQATATAAVKEERIRPYTRKWDAFVTKDIHEVRLRAARPEESASHRCDVRHDAPALVVTAGGYSRNLFHAFNDGFLPAWLTAQHLRRRVVVLALAYDPSWAGRFGELLAALSGYHVVDLLRDTRTHCFPGAIVGTRYHDYLAVDPARLRDNKTVADFHDFLAAAYDDEPGKQSTTTETSSSSPRRLRLGIVSLKGRRVIENQAAVSDLAVSVGFDVDVMETGAGRTPPLAATYAAVSAYDALVGVHGADLTAFLFLRPGRAALVQVAPLGISLLSRNLFGVPAARMGLRYEQYDLRHNESSLSRRYAPDDVVVADPARARRERGSKAWDLVEFVYLRGQNVTLDLARFRETLVRVHALLLQRGAGASPEI